MDDCPYRGAKHNYISCYFQIICLLPILAVITSSQRNCRLHWQGIDKLAEEQAKTCCSVQLTKLGL
jgi:hypothetical protein